MARRTSDSSTARSSDGGSRPARGSARDRQTSPGSRRPPRPASPASLRPPASGRDRALSCRDSRPPRRLCGRAGTGRREGSPGRPSSKSSAAPARPARWFRGSVAAFAGGLDAARRVLAERFGHPRFRLHQVRVLGPLLGGRNVLAVLPTGAGKSLCYQVPALLASGLTLVVSPLISLMQDQVAGLRRRGIAAAYLNSQLDAGQRRTVRAAALEGRVTLLYCAPEGLRSLIPRLRAAHVRVALLAVDEAHCILEWGNEFRPVYRRIFDSASVAFPTIASASA